MRYWPMVSEVFMLPGASYHALPPRVKAHDLGVLRLVAAFSRGGLVRRAAAPFSARRKSGCPHSAATSRLRKAVTSHRTPNHARRIAFAATQPTNTSAERIIQL